MRKLAILTIPLALAMTTACTSLKRMSHQDFNETIQQLTESHDKAPAPPSELTLTVAKRYALANNPDVTSATLRIDQALARLRQARSNYYPNLALSTSYDQTEWRPTYGSPFARNNRTQIYSSGISASWVLFDGLRRDFIELSARYGKEAAEAAAKDVRRLLCKGVAQAFLNALLQQEMVTIAEADLTFNQSLLKVAEDKKVSGAAAEPEILTFSIQRNEAEINLINARRNLDVAVIVLAELMGIGKADFKTIPTFKEPTWDAVVTAVDDDKELALAILRPDMQMLTRQTAAAEANVEAARSALYPTLNATGQFGYSRNDDMNYENDDKTGSIGVAAKWDFDIGGAKRAALAEAKSAHLEVKALLKSRYNSVCGEIKQEIARLQSATKTLSIFEKSSTMAKKLRDLEKQRYDLADISITRLTEVQSNLTRTQAREVITRIQLLMSLENLKAGTNTNQPKVERKTK